MLRRRRSSGVSEGVDDSEPTLALDHPEGIARRHIPRRHQHVGLEGRPVRLLQSRDSEIAHLNSAVADDDRPLALTRRPGA